MHLTGVTITGADDNVDPGVLADISAEYPWVEWGLLISKAPLKPRVRRHQHRLLNWEAAACHANGYE